MKRWLLPAAALAVLLVVPLARALADDESERKELLDDIDDKLGDAADDLRDIYRDSSASDVNSAIRAVDEVGNLVSKLDRVKGDDSTAKDIVYRYPGYISKFKESAQYLIKLKDKQRSLEPLPRWCGEKEKQLEQKIAQYVDAKNPSGLDELPRFADSMGRDAESKWRDAESIKRDMDQFRDYARRFGESDRKWSDVKSALHRSVDEVYGEWEKSWKQSGKDCENLRKGDDHPKVEAGMKRLASFSADRDSIIKEAEKALDAAAQLLSGAERDSDERDVQSALARADEVSTALGKLKYARGTDRRANEIVDRWPGYISQYKEAVRALIELKKWQYKLDSAVGTCEERKRALADEIARYKDATGIPNIENKARSLQQETKSSLDHARDHDRKMQDWNNTAQHLSLSDGKWSYVSGYVRSAARGTFDYWHNALAKAENTCEALERGTDNDTVQRAIASLRKRIPPPARHSSHHDSTCQGVPAGGFCMADDQCLDGTCSNHKCEQCPSRADGRCHPPGTCSQGDYNSRRDSKQRACAQPFNSDSYRGNQRVDCDALGRLCNNGQACVRAREVVQQCFRGGDSRHMEELNNVRRSVARCEALLKEKRERNLCQ